VTGKSPVEVVVSEYSGNNFHAIRYVLAALVLYSHSYGLLALREPVILGHTFGSFAVQGFFALSGYLIVLSCYRVGHLGHYFLNRILRILPALLVALLLSHFLSIAFDRFTGNPVQYIVNGPIWTLSWEVLCYILCGLLWWLGLLQTSALGGLLVALWVAFVTAPTQGETNAVIAPLMLLFFSGGFVALNERHLNLRVAGFFCLLVLAFLAVDNQASWIQKLLAEIPFLYGPGISAKRHQELIYLLCLPFALIWLGRHLKLKLSLRSDYSYGLYIFGWPVQQVLIALFPVIHPLVLFASALMITHLSAMISWHMLEKRALEFKF